MFSLLCLKDNYTHEGRALVEDLNPSALPESVQDVRGAVTALGRTFKQLNAPVGQFGSDAIHMSTTAIKSDAAGDAALESKLSTPGDDREPRPASIESQPR